MCRLSQISERKDLGRIYKKENYKYFVLPLCLLHSKCQGHKIRSFVCFKPYTVNCKTSWCSIKKIKYPAGYYS